jgi:hypothetical protein
MPTLVAALLAAALAAPAAADPFADRVVADEIGVGGGARLDELPGVVIGPPRGGGAFQGSQHTFSLGLGGSITVEFTDNVIVDGPGTDFTVFENAFLPHGLNTENPYAEPGRVSVSEDGAAWVAFPCAMDSAPFYPGCAGVYPVFASADDAGAPSPLVPSATPIAALVGVPFGSFGPPAGSGGDSFDLAEIGVARARFVRIEGGQIDPRLAGLSGFDLDAIAAINSADPSEPPDGDGDGFPDPTDACPAVADPDQHDADADGHGDACDGCPATPDPAQVDADGDAAGDACDPCPADASCLPSALPRFGGGGTDNAGDRLLGWVTPEAEVVTLPGATAWTAVVVIAADVEPGSVRVRIGRRDVTAAVGALVPGSTKVITVPLVRRRTVLKLRARGPREGRRRLVDVDRLTFLTE